MDPKRPILATAFIEGLCVLIVEIAGARALAPFYGTSLRVWTAQITATLLFLALGYGLGGKLSKAAGRFSLPGVFWGAGAWLGLFPWMRVTVLTVTATLPGVGIGAFAASSVLFGIPLLCLGAVSPLLIQRLQEGDRGGAAAGGIFLTNTLGGLAGGWLTALALVPHFPLRLVLAGTGLVLALLGSLWALQLKKASLSVGLPALLLISLFVAPRPLRSFPLGSGQGVILHAESSASGLIQVLDMQRDGYSQAVSLLLDGITQGGMDRASGLTIYEFTEYQAMLSWRFHPTAKRALLLGLGSGVLAKELHMRGLQVEVAEIEPRMEAIAREYFGLPAEVNVHAEDGRAYLQRSQEQYDLIFLDAFAGENAPWYLMTVEGLEAMKRRLAPGGRLLINTVTGEAGSPGLERLEAGLSRSFGEGLVFLEANKAGSSAGLVNACVVAGQGLKPELAAKYSSQVPGFIAERAQALLGRERPLRVGGPFCTDEHSDLESADAPLRLQWRKIVLGQMGAAVLGD